MNKFIQIYSLVVKELIDEKQNFVLTLILVPQPLYTKKNRRYMLGHPSSYPSIYILYPLQLLHHLLFMPCIKALLLSNRNFPRANMNVLNVSSVIRLQIRPADASEIYVA